MKEDIFRVEVNGLRAIAIIGVVLFHFNFNIFTGGFSGVDVFFAISGFLITKKIYGKLKSDSFLITQFYMSRANRIFPALSVMCLVIVALGWLLLSSLEYKKVGMDAFSSILFFSNILYSVDSSYFNPQNDFRWLLHTWSISVEWQFYIAFPIMLLGIKKFFQFRPLSIFALLVQF